MFRERYNGRQQALFHVLAAYSVYNSEVGYCQGKFIIFWWKSNKKELRITFHNIACLNNTLFTRLSGMSQIAALLLMYLIDEEDAFWALSQLMVDNKYAMHGK